MFVFLHSQHECLSAHNIVSFSAKYAQVTGMWNGVWFFFFVVVVVVCPDSCSLATPHSPIPVVNKGWETVLLKTSSLVPRRQKVALWVYYLYKFFFYSSCGRTRLPGAEKRWTDLLASSPASGDGVQPLPGSGSHLLLLPPQVSFSSLVSWFSPLTL